MSQQILYNAKIYTLTKMTPVVSAIAIQNDRILEIGNDDYIRGKYPSPKIIHDLEGRTVIPGLTDSHIHLKHYALGLQKINCEVPTKEECLRRVAERAQRSSPGEWILGHGWNQNDWTTGFGTAHELDLAAPDNPVYLTAKSLHSAWANSSALQAAQIDLNTPDPADGVIQRDEHGDPTGILMEGAAALVSKVIPEPTLDEVEAAILDAQEKLLSYGITGVHDFDRNVCFTALQRIHTARKLKLRVLKSIPLESLQNAVEIGLCSGFGDDVLRIGAVKMFTDGALGPHTAAMMQAYENAPDNQGMLLMDCEEIIEHGSIAINNGLSLAIHAIGDRANHETLNALEYLKSLEGQSKHRSMLRHRIEHVQILLPNDTHRLASLGVIASMQPIHAISDMRMADDFWGARAANAYAWQTQLSHGAILAFGSDAPVESPNPFWGLSAAITRKRVDGDPGSKGWYPEQRLSRQDALRGYTTGPAYAANMEDRLGKLAHNYLADLLILDRDPLTCDEADIREIQTTAVMIGGEWIFGEPA